MQNGRRTWPNVANTMENGRRTWPNVANTMQNAKWPFQNVANTTQNDRFYIDGLKLRMRIWKHHSTRAKLKNCILPAFRNLECLPPPRMKLFCNQQLECLQGYIFFQAETHIYPRPSKSPQKKGSSPHNFHSFSNFSGYLEVLGIWMYLFENITLFFLCTLQVCAKIPWKVSMNQQAAQRHFYSLSPFGNLDKSEFRVQKLRFWTHTWGR